MTKLEVLNLLEELLNKSAWLTVNKPSDPDYEYDYDKTIDVQDLLNEIYRAKLLEVTNEDS